MLVITYSVTVGGLLLPIGSPPNLMGREKIEAAGKSIDFFQWFVMALPVVVVMFIAVMAVALFLNRPEVKAVPGFEDYVAEEKRRLGPMSRGERNTLIVFGLAVLGWCLPGLVGLFNDGKLYKTLEQVVLNEGVVAVIAAALLFVLPLNWAERKFTLTWSQAARIDWGTIVLFGSGLA